MVNYEISKALSVDMGCGVSSTENFELFRGNFTFCEYSMEHNSSL